MEQKHMHIPGFPAIPFLFPIGVALGLLTTIAWLEYRIWHDLRSIESYRR